VAVPPEVTLQVISLSTRTAQSTVIIP